MFQSQTCRLGKAGEDVDVVIDYLWGEPTADALGAIIPNRADDSQQLTWLQIGSVAGSTAPIPSAALRAECMSKGQRANATSDSRTWCALNSRGARRARSVAQSVESPIAASSRSLIRSRSAWSSASRCSRTSVLTLARCAGQAASSRA